MERMSAPGFWNVEEFAADVMFCTPDHVRHAARNYVDPAPRRSRAKLPDGFGAFLWGSVYVIFELRDAEVIEKMFNVKVTT